MQFKSLLSSLIAFVIIISVSPMVQAETKVTADVKYSIRDWKLDEENGYIYALASKYMGNPSRVLFLDQNDLSVKADIALAGKKVEYVNGKLYVLGNGDKTITVIDVLTKSIDKTYQTNKNAADIEVGGGKLFYVDNTNLHSSSVTRLHVVDLETWTEKPIQLKTNSSFSMVDIELDSASTILYMAEQYSPSNKNGAKIQAIDTNDYSILHDYYNRDESFFQNALGLIVEGSDVFYASYRFDATHLKNIYGSYENKNIQHVMGDFVFTSDQVFDRQTFKKIIDLERPISFMDSENYAYYYREEEMGVSHIAKFPLELERSQTIHIVQSGDTLWKLSQTYETTIKSIAKVNGIDVEKPLLIGQELMIPEVKEIIDSRIDVTNVPVHPVVYGDTYWKIAKQYNSTIQAIREFNLIDPQKELWAGTKLMIPVYKVKEGDAAWKIANAFDMTVYELVELNEMEDPNMIVPNQWLRVSVKW
jgi:LysM repeat protein